MSNHDVSSLERWHALQSLLVEHKHSSRDDPSSLVLVFRAAVPIEEIGATTDDLIVLDPSESDHPVAIYRPLPVTSVVDLVRRLGDLELLLPQSTHPAWAREAETPKDRAAHE